MRQLTGFAKIILFLTAYTPLGIICLILDYQGPEFPFFQHAEFALGLLLFMLLMLALLYWMITHFERQPGGEKMKLVKVRNMNSEILSYIFSYLLPFLDFPEDRRYLVTLFLLLIVGVLYTRSDMIGINPVLSLAGYNIVKVEWKKDGWEKSKEAMLISKLDYFQIKDKSIVDAIQMHHELFLVKE